MAKDVVMTPMMKQYFELKEKHPDAVMLFRCGDFYETYSEDAITAANILGITLTKRANGQAKHVEMAGFPFHALDTYLPKLVRAGKRVAICDQLEDPKLTKKLVKRGITELVTPGVAINDNVLSYKENNFLAAVHFGKPSCGVAFLDISTGEFLTAIVRGANIRFYSEQFNPTKILELIKEYGITAFCGTPTLLSIMARFNRSNASETLRHICISGECMGAEVGRKIRAAFPTCRIYHIYGLTEACPRVSYLPPEHFEEYPDCVGIPLKSVSIKILNEQGNLCRANEEGILYIKGENVMLGYYREPEKTAKVLKDGWLCTGDIAIINDAGFLKIKGRNDDLIIKSGMNVYPAEIEGVVKQDLRVKEILVYGFQNSFGTQIGMKLVGAFSSVEEVKQLCMKVLPSFQVPSVIELVDELPKNGSGKIIRRKML